MEKEGRVGLGRGCCTGEKGIEGLYPYGWVGVLVNWYRIKDIVPVLTTYGL